MTVQIANNAKTVLTDDASDVATVITVQNGALFPSLAAVGDTFPLTLISWDGRIEICRCIARSGNQLTLLRAQEGTAAQPFYTGDRAELRLTKATWDERFAEKADADQVRAMFNVMQYGDGPYPVLDAVFQGAKYLDPRFTFSRSTTSTYIDDSGVLRTAAPNEPVFENGALRLEPQATNLLKNSANQMLEGWFTATTTLSMSTVTGPDGTTPAIMQVPIVSGTFRQVTASIALTADTRYTFTQFIKPAGYSWIQAVGSSATFGMFYQNISLIDGSLGAGNSGPAGANPTYEIVKLVDGWWRISVSITTVAASPSANLNFCVIPSGEMTRGQSWTADGTSGNLISGTQMEVGASTSYIPTTAAAVTRASDNMSIQGQAFADVFNQDEGAIVIDYDVQVRGTSDTPYTDRLLALGDSTKADPFRFYMNGSVLGLYSDQVGNGVTVVQPFQTGRFKLGLAWRDGNVNVFAQGAKKISSFAMFSAPNKLTLYGLTAASWAPMTNYRVRQFAQRPTDAQLQAMTAP